MQETTCQEEYYVVQNRTMETLHKYVRFQVLTAAGMKMRDFYDLAPYSFVGVDRCFRGVYCLHHRGDDGGRGFSSSLQKINLHLVLLLSLNQDG
jgi:hypothetical protein